MIRSSGPNTNFELLFVGAGDTCLSEFKSRCTAIGYCFGQSLLHPGFPSIVLAVGIIPSIDLRLR